MSVPEMLHKSKRGDVLSEFRKNNDTAREKVWYDKQI
jgi:hypothetical protein